MTSFSLPSAVHMVAESVNRNNDAAKLFSSALAAGRTHRLMASIRRRPTTLRSLETNHGKGTSGRYAGLKLVAIDDIRGSEGRKADFDDQFNPLTDRMRQRWQSVAGAIAAGLDLPPVDLIQVGNSYYVRDGHHRVSVTRAMGGQEIEARVTVWKVDQEL